MPTTIKIIPAEKMSDKAIGKVAEAEMHFTTGILAGLKFIGFAVWTRRTGSGLNVTFPARQYSVNGERRSCALLRPSAFEGQDPQSRIRDLIVDAYQRTDDHPDVTAWTYDDDGRCTTTTPSAAGPVLDHPRVRASLICPLCNHAKDANLIACWDCYRAHDMRNGLQPATAAIIDNAERQTAPGFTVPGLF